MKEQALKDIQPGIVVSSEYFSQEHMESQARKICEILFGKNNANGMDNQACLRMVVTTAHLTIERQKTEKESLLENMKSLRLQLDEQTVLAINNERALKQTEKDLERSQATTINRDERIKELEGELAESNQRFLEAMKAFGINDADD